jgi:hypothetical protein
MMILALVSTFVLMGCPDPNGSSGPGEEDIWSKITSVNEMAGTWAGATVFPTPAQADIVPASSIGLKVHMTIDATTLSETLIMDMNTFLTDAVGPLGKAVMWQTIRQNIPPQEEGVDIETTDDYKMVINVSVPVGSVDYSGENAELAPYINQHKTKVKAVFPSIMLKYTEEDIVLILIKQ